MSKDYQKQFGKHVIAFYGSVNGKPQRPFVSIHPSDEIDDPCFGEWVSLRDAERLAKNILKAVEALRKREAKP